MCEWLYVYMHGSLYVCASVYRCISMKFICMCEFYRCICMEVYMYVRVFIGVYAWKFICMCECFIGVYAWKFICMCECLEVICMCECL